MSKQQRSKRLTVVEQNIVERASVSALKEALDKQGGAQAVTVRRTGNSVKQGVKVASPAVLSDMQAQGKVIASKIVAHLEGGERGIYAEAMHLSKQDLPCKISALGEITSARKTRIEETQRDYEGEFAERKINSIRASFSRIIVVIEAMVSNVNSYDFSGCESFGDMIAVARTFSSSKGKNIKTLNASGFSTWVEKADRIVDVKNYDVKSDVSVAQVARLEQFIIKAVVAYGKVSEKVPNLRFNVADLQACVGIKMQAPKARHIKAA